MFDDCFKYILRLEGGYVDNKNDSGGATNFGISTKYLKSIIQKRTQYDEFNDVLDRIEIPITKETIKNIDIEDARLIYLYDWWIRCNIEPLGNLLLCRKVFSACINIGEKKAVKLLQESINSLFTDFKVDEDGKIGNQTVTAVSKIDKEALIDIYVLNLCEFYKNLSKEKKQFSGFLKGWLNRAKE
jgi:lysozyme family protein